MEKTGFCLSAPVLSPELSGVCGFGDAAAHPALKS